MLMAIVVAQLGQSIPARGYRCGPASVAALSYSLATVLIALGIPFVSRPWFRL